MRLTFCLIGKNDENTLLLNRFLLPATLTNVGHCVTFSGMELQELQYEFSAEKNQLIIAERGISFDEVISAIREGAVLDILAHHNPSKFPNQKIYVLNINNYVYVVPFVRKDKNTIFLKTIFPTRKLTKQYFKVEDGKNEKK